MVSARARPLDDAVHLPFGFWPVAADRAPGGGDIRGVPVSDNLWDGLSFGWLARPICTIGAHSALRRPSDGWPISQALDGQVRAFVARLTARPRCSCRSRRGDPRGRRA